MNTRTNSHTPSTSLCLIQSTIAIILLLVCFLTDVKAQSSTDGTTPLGLTPGSPSGTYPLSDFDVVNLFNGTLSFSLPIYQIAGRGGAAYPITLKVGRKWTVYRHFEPGIGDFYYAQGAWWSENVPPAFGVGNLQIRTGYREQPRGFPVEGLTRVTFTAPDGTEYELRDQLTGGQPKAPVAGGFNRGTVFVTADGTTATFISDWDIHETEYGFGFEPLPPDGYVKLKDGTTFRVDDGKIMWMRDRNGNKVTFGFDIYSRVTSITDSLNRVVSITYPDSVPGFTQITFKGYGGASRTIKLNSTSVSNALRSDYTPLNGSQLFPEMHGVWGPGSVLQSIELPDGRTYQLRYNPYGELARVVLPTGGAVEYDYAAGLTNGAANGVFSHTFPSTEKYVYRRVIERRVYPDCGSGSAYESKMTYSRPETTTTNVGYVITEQRNASGTLLAKSQHYFYGSARQSFLMRPTHYQAWKDAREYKTEVFDTNGTTILRRVEHTFAQRAAVSWWGGTSETAPPNDSRTIETVTTIEPATANLVSKQTFGFDDTVPFNNQNNVKEYNFGTGAAGSLARETRSTFVTSSSYTDNAVHLRGLPSQVSIYDAGGTERARTVYEYDNYLIDTNHAALTNRTNISGLDAAFTTGYSTRGNVTATTRNLFNTSGGVTGSVSAYHQYDIAGNAVKAIDGRGNATLLDFDDRFGAPDGNAQANSGATELGSQISYAYATKVTNPLFHTSYSQFDFYLGRPVDTEDANGMISSAYYNDSLDRATQVRRAVEAGGPTTQISFSYDDANRTITTQSDLYSLNDNVLNSQTTYDGLGRATETRLYEGGSNFIARQTQYDALGRPYKTSNPFRPWQNQSAVWTTQTFDALGRVISVTSPDNAAVSTVYSGNTVTVTDPAGQARRTRSDG
jgi:YD repeat-containing protein